MNYIEYLPYNVTQDPSIGCLDIHPYVCQKFIIRITDAWGKVWYLRTICRNGYAWTRSQCYARLLSMETAKKHADRIASCWKACLEESENA